MCFSSESVGIQTHMRVGARRLLIEEILLAHFFQHADTEHGKWLRSRMRGSEDCISVSRIG